MQGNCLPICSVHGIAKAVENFDFFVMAFGIFKKGCIFATLLKKGIPKKRFEIRGFEKFAFSTFASHISILS